MTEDALLDVLEGDEEADPTQPNEVRQQEHRVLKAQKGCNLHYKRSVLAAGWVVSACGKGAPPGQKWCVGQVQAANPALRTMSPKELLTYTWQKEAVYAACEHSVGRHQDKL